ncbi:MAG: hypothetical protein ACLP8A_04395 [Methylovirgula sp.]
MDDFSKELAVSEAPTKAVVIDLSIDFVVSPATAPYLFLNDVNFYICWVRQTLGALLAQTRSNHKASCRATSLHSKTLAA